MYRVKPILSFVTVAAFLVAVVVGSVDAGALAGKKLLVDTVFNMVDDNANKVNDGVNTIAPSMSMAGDTIKVELFIEDGGGNDIIGGTVAFSDSDMEMMFDDSWQVVAVDGIVGVLGAGGIKVDEFTLGGLSAVTIGDNGYFATVKIMAKADISDGASFYARHAIIGTAGFEQDSLDVSEAIITVEAPKGPTIMGMGDALMTGDMLQIPAMGGIKVDEFTLGGLSAVTIGDNGYFATVKIMAKADISDGASFYARHAIIGTAGFEQDSLDVSEAIITVEAPKGPTIMGMGGWRVLLRQTRDYRNGVVRAGQPGRVRGHHNR
jgi:hypothetical protein